MEKKILLFNYFLQKAVQKEQELFQVDNFRAALLALIMSRASVFHRCASGCTTSMAYICKPKYAEELFLCLALNAEQNGDALLKNFQFRKTHSFTNLYFNEGDFEDVELTRYLEEIYPVSSSLNKEDKALYSSVLNEPFEDISAALAGSALRKVAVDKLPVPEKDTETAMIDRAWERLMAENEFSYMLTLKGKYDMYGRSYPYLRYMREHDFLQNR